MRFQPKDGEFERLDQMDEKIIISGSGKLYHQLNDLVSLSYFGMLEIAKTNSIDCIDQSLQVTSTLITATVEIHNPKTGWKGYGASQCKNSLSNQAQNVAVKKAFRNAVRLSFPPYYLRKCLKQLLNNRGLS